MCGLQCQHWHCKLGVWSRYDNAPLSRTTADLVLGFPLWRQKDRWKNNDWWCLWHWRTIFDAWRCVFLTHRLVYLSIIHLQFLKTATVNISSWCQPYRKSKGFFSEIQQLHWDTFIIKKSVIYYSAFERNCRECEVKEANWDNAGVEEECKLPI